jgi:hypothetical protein
MTRATLLMLTSLPLLAGPAAAQVSRETVDAWNGYVKAVSDRPSAIASRPQGRLVHIPGGSIYHSTGSTLIRNTTVERVLAALMHPGTPPPQEDVLESRVLWRDDRSLRIYLKLVRTSIVAVVYDTEHQVTFTRHSPVMATSRSESVRIVEHGGTDRGFLWRLNSYWRYTQIGHDVRVDLESLSLSRGVPPVARAVARPIVDRIAHDALRRTLSAVQRFLQTTA